MTPVDVALFLFMCGVVALATLTIYYLKDK